MAPTLYVALTSPAVRAVLIFAKAIGLELDVKPLHLQVGEHLTPEFLKINPQHTVPTLVDVDGFAIWESHAIIPYLYAKYGKNDVLYPLKDIKRRAVIDQRMHFDNGVAFATIKEAVGPLFRKQKPKVDDEFRERLEPVYKFLEAFLDGNTWIAGEELSIADYCLIATISTYNVMFNIDAKKFPKLTDWLARGDALPECEANKEGLQLFRVMVKDFL